MLKLFPPPFHVSKISHVYVNSWASTTNYPTPFDGWSATISNGDVVSIGGAISSSGVFTVNSYIYTPSNVTFTAITSYPLSGYTISTLCSIANGSCFMFCAANTSSSIVNSYRYDPVPGTYTAISNYPVTGGVYGLQAVTINSTAILVWGGANNSGYAINNAYIYNPSIDTYSQVASYPYAITYHAGALLPNGSVLSTGGATNGTYITKANSYVFSPVANSWASANAYPNALSCLYMSAVTLSNGCPLFIGGASNADIDSANCFTYSNNVWYQVASYPLVINSVAPALLGNGSVLVIGGFTSTNNAYTNLCYIYN